MLLYTGEDGKQDPLVQLPQHFADGTKAAAATGRMHFYYGLSSDLSGRDAASSGCKHIREHCIGAPYRFVVELRDSSIATLVGKPSTFAFAAYLSAWERMPAGTHISAVFDLAERCVEDIGDNGVDDDTGVGRLDIGCLAYQATQALECPDGQQLTGEGRCEPIECDPNELLLGNLCVVKKVCEVGQAPDETNTCRPLVCPAGTSAVGNECVPLGYWSEMQSHMYVSGTESPLQKAFRVAGIGTLKADRSSQAHILHSGTASQGEEMVDFLAGAGVASSQYTYNDLSGMDAEKVRDAYLAFIPNNMVYIPSHGELPPFTAVTIVPGIEDEHVRTGAWIVTDIGPELNLSSFGHTDILRMLGMSFSSESNRMHMYYGLDASANLTVRHSPSNDCSFSGQMAIIVSDSSHHRFCIGAPSSFNVQLRDGITTKTLNGIPSAFAFASYLLAWERMPANTHISAVFDLAERCVEDLGEPGPDDETGAGRLDIGCLAYEATQVPECELPAFLVGTTCRGGYFFNHLPTSHATLTSPHQLALKDAGIESRLVDRSMDSYVVDSASHGGSHKEVAVEHWPGRNRQLHLCGDSLYRHV